jgi:hypothetical protein
MTERLSPAAFIAQAQELYTEHISLCGQSCHRSTLVVIRTIGLIG